MFIPEPGHGTVSDGEVTGKKGLSYHWDQDEGHLSLAWKIGDLNAAIPYLDARIGLDGIYYDEFHHPVARAVDGHLVFDMDALDADARDAAAIPVGVATTSDDRPKLCPDPGPDYPHGASPRALAYQQQITGLEPGLAIWFNKQNYDGCRETDGTLLEAKGPGYAAFIKGDGSWYTWFTRQKKLMTQLEDQSIAAGGRIVEWHVAEKTAADTIREMAKPFTNVRVIWDPETK